MLQVFRLKNRLVLYTSALLLAAVVVACGDVKTATEIDDAAALARDHVNVVSITPSSATVQVGEAVQLTATTIGPAGVTLSGKAVTWTSANSAVATVDGSGRVTGRAAGSAVLGASSEGKRGEAAVTVVAATSVPIAVASVTVNPASVSITTGATSSFTATLRDAAGNVLTGSTVTWNSTDTNVATVSSTGLATGNATGNATGTASIRATSGGITGSASLTVSAAMLQSVVLTPASVSLNAGATQQFSVSGQWSNGATTAPAVTYHAAGGTITAGGLYTAGATAGTFRVIAMQQGGTLADTSLVTVSAAAPILQAVILNPASASVASGATRPFSVSGQWSDGATTAPAVTYTATGGTISSGGLYTAGSTSGTFRVIAVQQGGTLADTAVVAVSAVAPVLQAVILTPASASLTSGATRQFSVSGQWSDGATTAPTVTYSATGGSITSGGLYTAGSAAGTFRVVAVQQGGTLADTAVVAVSVAGGATGIWIEENFSTYTSTANMLADPRGIYSEAEDEGAGGMVLDMTSGYGASGRSMRYDFTAKPASCSSYAIGRNLTLPAVVTEVWVEAIVKFSNGFATTNPGCGGVSNPDLKFLFGRVSGADDRFGSYVGNSGNAIVVGYPTNSEAATLKTTLSDLADGAWHSIRVHWKVGKGTGISTWWVDGVKESELTGISTGAVTGIFGLAMGRNLNQGPAVSQSYSWGRMLVYNTDPGWR